MDAEYKHDAKQLVDAVEHAVAELVSDGLGDTDGICYADAFRDAESEPVRQRKCNWYRLRDVDAESKLDAVSQHDAVTIAQHVGDSQCVAEQQPVTHSVHLSEPDRIADPKLIGHALYDGHCERV